MFFTTGHCNVSPDVESPTPFLLVRSLLFHNVVFSFHGNLLEFQPSRFSHRPNPDQISLLFLGLYNSAVFSESLVLEFSFSGWREVNILFLSSRPAAVRPLLSLPSVNKFLLSNMKTSSLKGLVMSFLPVHPVHPLCLSPFLQSPTVPPPAQLRVTCSFLVSFVALPWRRMYSFTIRYDNLCFFPPVCSRH